MEDVTQDPYSIDGEADPTTRPDQKDYIAVSREAPPEPDPYQEIPTVQKLIDQLDFLIFFLEHSDEFYRYFIWESGDPKYHKNVHDLVNNMFRKDRLGVDLMLPVLQSEQEFCLALLNACREGEKKLLPEEGYPLYVEALEAVKDAFALFEAHKLGGITPWDIARMKTYLYKAKEITHFHFLRGNKESYYTRLVFLKKTNDETGFKDLDSFYIPRLWLNRKTGQIHMDKTQVKVILKTGYGNKQWWIKEIYKVGAAIAVPIAPITLAAWNMADDYGPGPSGGIATAMQLLTGTLVYFFMYLLLRNFFVKDYFSQNDRHSYPLKTLEKRVAEKKPKPLPHVAPLAVDDDSEQRRLDNERKLQADREAAVQKALLVRDPFELTDTEQQPLEGDARRGHGMPSFESTDLMDVDEFRHQESAAAARSVLAGTKTVAALDNSAMDNLLNHFAILAGNVQNMVAVAGHRINLIPYSTDLPVILTEDLNTIGGTKENAVEGANFRINNLNKELGINIPANHPMKITVDELNALTTARPINMQAVLSKVSAIEMWLVDQMLNAPVQQQRPQQPLQVVVDDGGRNNNNLGYQQAANQQTVTVSKKLK